MAELMGWEKLAWQCVDWKALSELGVQVIEIKIENRPDVAVMEIKYDNGRQDVVAYKKTPLDITAGPAA